MKIKVSELSGIALDWAVAKCEGHRTEYNPFLGRTVETGWWQCGPFHWQPLCKYSSNWSQGGPIIERERIEILYFGNRGYDGNPWEAQIGGDYGYIDQYPGDGQAYGETPLIAAMRCYVASKMGEEVEIPNELMETNS